MGRGDAIWGRKRRGKVIRSLLGGGGSIWGRKGGWVGVWVLGDQESFGRRGAQKEEG